ncbi:thiamine phosphate synthase [Legionella brunensis]|uniref:Thiamine-phosphate synthase n=1 Tax=Legionella brunensis TaxID=29422 RepID=A0A0W0S4J8_9GAMM|nr:thiamine phosphate synthase [Legionella brunensis]KTC78360.1 bifunctional phosphomethylpyrimidine kinase ThiD/thiamin- phosphate pyrophosphorylase ThiE [Legionella brunensis]
MKKPIIWSIAGVDPSGLAGTQVDLETFKNFNVDSCSIITAVTAQNACAVTAIESISSDHVAAQCEALQQAFKPKAIKIGMLGTLSTHEKIAHFLANYSGFVVLDPVLASSSGTALIFSNVKQHLESLVKLFPYVDIVTPNLIEAEKILNRSLTSYQDIQEGAHTLLSLGAKSVLLKGGHAKDSLFSQDYWTNGQESFWLANQRLPNKNYRGTGCTLSSAIAACLALGYSIKDAIVIAKMYVNRGIRKALDIDRHTAKLFHGAWPEDEIDLPYLSPKPLLKLPEPFKHCQIGLYPVVDSSRWLEKLLPHGVKCIQLRIKNMPKNHLEEEIKQSILWAKKYNATLFINDYWDLAIRFGAKGVHLGQEDLYEADIDKIHQSGLCLGVSTHCYYEVATAHAINPSYIACGPIYPTTSKIMSFSPQGIEQLQRWRRTLHYPLVAIGGINLERLPEVCKSGVDGVSLISAITKATNSDTTAQQFLTQIKELCDD